MLDSYAAAWQQAVQLERELASSCQLGSICAPLEIPLSTGEAAIGNFSGLTYERYLTADVRYIPPRDFVFGPPHFVAGYLFGSTIRDIRGRRKARKLSAPQWRCFPSHRTVVTTHRIWCELMDDYGPRWLQFDFAAIATAHLDEWTLVLNFHTAAPLRLTGAWAPWIAVAVAYFRYGPYNARNVPGISTLLSSCMRS